MRNVFKDNSLASFLLGILIGCGGLLLGQNVFTFQPEQGQIHGFMDGKNVPSKTTDDQSNFDRIQQNDDGDVVVTPNGKAYHYDYCYTLRKSSKLMRVSSSDAEAAGLKACSKCIK